MNPEPADTVNGAWMPTVVFLPMLDVVRDALLTAFQADNIDGRVFFWPLSSLQVFTPRPKNTVAYGLPGRAINLPSYHDMTSVEQDRVIALVRAVVEAASPIQQGAAR